MDKNRTSLHSVWDFVFKTRGSFSSGRGGQFAKGRDMTPKSWTVNNRFLYTMSSVLYRTHSV